MEEPKEYEPGKFSYRSWKILSRSIGGYECVRISPVDWFTSNSVRSAVKIINKREEDREKGLDMIPQERKSRLMDFLRRKKSKKEAL